jgi:hypothetical protein
MYCPTCGIEEKRANQFCRACGTDWRGVRQALESPDRITASAASARDEIGRAFAAKIREAQTSVDLKIIADSVLPQIEEFLESPEERRMRRLRAGTIVSLIGLGATVGFTIAAMLMADSGILLVAGAGVVVFFIGLAFFINGLFLTVPKKIVSDRSSDAADQRALDTQMDANAAPTNELKLPSADQVFASVTEDTTRHLREKQSVPRS